jgi:hypothetical protein
MGIGNGMNVCCITNRNLNHVFAVSLVFAGAVRSVLARKVERPTLTNYRGVDC